MSLTKRHLAEITGLSTSRLNVIISGKNEPSLRTGREMSRRLGIDPAVVLGV